eukprot:COSAG02_NODE_15087_length_1205_cov_1.326401_1_plen_311_part_10
MAKAVVDEDSSSRPWPYGSGSGWVDLPNQNMAPNYNPPTERWQRWRAQNDACVAGAEDEGASRAQRTTAVREVPDDAGTEAVLDALATDRAVVVRTRLRHSLCEAAATVPHDHHAQTATLISTLGPKSSSELLAEPLVMEVCDAVLCSQALRMGAGELAERVVVPPGNFTANRPILQLPWELDYVQVAQGQAPTPPNLMPEIQTLRRLDIKLTVVWQLADDDPGDEPTGWVHEPLGNCPVRLCNAGDALIIVGGGSARWSATAARARSLATVGYQLGMFAPTENFYLTHDASAVATYPVELQRLLGYHMPG